MKTTKKTFILGAGYTHFAINKANGLILSGWDYKGYSSEDLNSDKQYYFFNDLSDWFDFPINKKDVTILTRSSVEKLNITISDSNYWQK